MRKRLLLLVLILLFPCIVLASTNTKSRDHVNNYGVTKYKVTEENEKDVLKTPYVDATEMIYDFSDILTDEEEEKLLDKIREFKEKTNFDFVFLSSRLEYNQDIDNEYYASDFYDFNDFDRNGIIFYRNTYEKDTYFGLYSFGEAQLYYYDNRADKSLESTIDEILDDIYYDIKNKKYMSGMDELFTLLDRYYSRGKLSGYFVDSNGYLRNEEEYTIDENGNLKSNKKGYFLDKDGILRSEKDYYYDEKGKLIKKIHYDAPIIPSIIISGIITAIVMSIMVSKNKMIRVATRASEYVDRKSIYYVQKEDKFVTTSTSRSYIGSSSSSSGSGGHSSFGGHSGGGHSGGGRHG